ncbi:MAG: hypothetical protein WBV16_13260 [Desulfobaccales bacterium]
MTSIKPSVPTRDDLRIALQIGLVCLESYLAGFYFTHLFLGAWAAVGGLWSLISGVVVLQATRRDTWASASLAWEPSSVLSPAPFISVSCPSIPSGWRQ